jgi:peptidoglycan hydrolase-like protein with peptidoglycan-binding domain
MATYTVRSGDTLSAIAARYRTSVSSLASANGIRNVNVISVGQKLNLPGTNAAAPAPAPAARFAVPSQDLSRGAQGAAVKQLQDALVSLGFMTRAQVSTGPGIYGPKTESAVKQFQAKHGISTTGNYGPQTRAALQRLSSGGTSSSAPATQTPAPTSSFTIPGQDLKRGSQGPAVKQLQDALVKLGYLSSATAATGPGTFGPATEAALKKFQSKNGVSATGYYGPQTRAAFAKLGGRASNASSTNATNATNNSSGGASGSGALGVAQRYLGRRANELKLANNDPVGKAMQDWVPGNVNCANFISGVLVAAKQISFDQRNASVYNLIGTLRRDPQWKQVPLSQARPGDVIAFKTSGGQHVEMVAGRDGNGLKMIGSNNILADGTQQVSYNYYKGNAIIAVMRYVG